MKETAENKRGYTECMLSIVPPEDRLGDYNRVCSGVFLCLHFMLRESLYGNLFGCLDLCGRPVEDRLLPPFENVMVQFLKIFSV